MTHGLLHIFWGLVFALALQSTPAFTASSSAVEGQAIVDGAKVVATPAGHKGLVVVFLSSQCPCSNSHINELKSLVTDYPQFQFVGVHSNHDETVESARIYFTQAALPFPVIQDSDLKLADRFKALKTPHSFVLRPDGSIAFQGGVSSSHEFAQAEHKWLREALQDIKQDKKVRTASARTLGCAISRR